jgi:hypothetical protein
VKKLLALAAAVLIASSIAWGLPAAGVVAGHGDGPVLGAGHGDGSILEMRIAGHGDGPIL